MRIQSHIPLRNFLILLFLIWSCPSITNSQSLGGHSLYGFLANAIHPNGCNDGAVAHFPDDSIWVNLSDNTITIANFTLPDIDSIGTDLLLETGFHPSNYIVSLLLTTGLYSASHNVTTTDWDTIPGFITWKTISNLCSNNVSGSMHFIVPLDYSLDFGLTVSDTVIGIRIEFLTTPGSPDLAGAYLINLQQVGINEQIIQSVSDIFPNPFSDKIYFTKSNHDMSEIILYDITSRIILRQKFTNAITLYTEQLLKGVYIYEVGTDNGVIKTGKVVKD